MSLVGLKNKALLETQSVLVSSLLTRLDGIVAFRSDLTSFVSEVILLTEEERAALTR